jgi:hypothetical protein
VTFGRTALPALAITGAAQAAPQAWPEHRFGGHRRHSCPSDHATYRWRGLLCVTQYSDAWPESQRRRTEP